MSMRRVSVSSLHPVIQRHSEMRRANHQDRLADAITTFAGSMAFVSVHLIWFGLWIGLRVKEFPFGLLTMIVSLEAIFLSIFLLISANRQDEARRLLAESEWDLVERDEIELELDDFYFAPTVLKGAPGQQFKLELMNEGSVEHNFTLEDQSIDQDVDGGENASVTAAFPDAGFLVFYCKYHRGQGMVGELTA